jgi:hypothetical protein
VINGIRLPAEDDPRWPAGDAAETARAPGAIVPAPRGPVPVRRGPAARGSPVCVRLGAAAGNALRTAAGLTVAWLIGLPRRAGRLLFAANDTEAWWRGWHVTERAGGLGRRYRDARFALDTERRLLTPQGPPFSRDAADGYPDDSAEPDTRSRTR